MWQLCDSARPVLTDAGGAILDVRAGRWTYLAPTAAAAVLLLLAAGTEEAAAEQYAQRYGIGADRAAADVRAVAVALTARGLARAEPGRGRRRWGWWR